MTRRPGARRPEVQPRGRARTVVVLETSDVVKLALAKSLLESANVPFATRHEGFHYTGEPGVVGGWSPAGGDPTIAVLEEDAARARAELAGLETR